MDYSEQIEVYFDKYINNINNIEVKMMKQKKNLHIHLVNHQ